MTEEMLGSFWWREQLTIRCLLIPRRLHCKNVKFEMSSYTWPVFAYIFAYDVRHSQQMYLALKGMNLFRTTEKVKRVAINLTVLVLNQKILNKNVPNFYIHDKTNAFITFSNLTSYNSDRQNLSHSSGWSYIRVITKGRIKYWGFRHVQRRVSQR